MLSQVSDSGSGANPTRSSSGTVALLCGCWFLLTSWMWTFLFNLVISYPVGIYGLLVWVRARKSHPHDKKVSIAGVLLGLGLATSLVALVLYK